MMKIYVHEKGVTFVGKAWEIKEKLKVYQKSFSYVREWIDETTSGDYDKKPKNSEHHS